MGAGEAGSSVIAAKGTDGMKGAEEFLPDGGRTIPSLRRATRGCRGCDLYRRATQTVFGHGDPHARVMLVGEQPGDQKDRQGAPFVGPAGRLLDTALEEAGLGRQGLYVTNAVKHFKWEQKGTRRLHAQPSVREVEACKPWLLAEVEVVRPQLIVCLGATAARSLLGPGVRVTQHRGELLAGPSEIPVLVTVHPASIVRVRDDGERRTAMAAFVEDLREVVRTRH
jgi:DNA polymerase